MVKGGADKRVTMAAGSLAHPCYQVFLLGTYTKDNMSEVHPIARGLAPLVVTAISVALPGERLALPELLAVALIALG